MLPDVCSVIIVTPVGGAEEPLQKEGGLHNTLVSFHELYYLPH